MALKSSRPASPQPPLRPASIQGLVIPAAASQLNHRVRDEGPGRGADHIPGLPEVLDLGKSSLESMRAVVLDHGQRRTPSIDVVQMMHGLKLRAKTAPSPQLGGCRFDVNFEFYGCCDPRRGSGNGSVSHGAM